MERVLPSTGPGPARLAHCLARLVPHLRLASVALTGSVAIRAHLAARGVRHERAAGDVDFVATSPDAVCPSVAAELLVSHFHRPHAGYSRFLVQLVDPVAGLRIDVFPGPVDRVRRAPVTLVEGVPLPVLELDAILDHKLATLAGAGRDRPVEEKHFHDAVRLGALCGRAVPAVSPEHLCREEYSRDPSAGCARCDASRDARFPLAPKERILEILGHV